MCFYNEHEPFDFWSVTSAKKNRWPRQLVFVEIESLRKFKAAWDKKPSWDSHEAELIAVISKQRPNKLTQKAELRKLPKL